MRLILVATLPAALAGCGGGGSKTAAQPAKPLAPVRRSSGCRVRGGLPDRGCTPGAVLPGVTVKRLCAPGYVQGTKFVTAGSQRTVYRAYGLARRRGATKLDHLVPRGLAGSNIRPNLWPESTRRLGFYEKEALANYLHHEVCRHHLPLARAQTEIARDWLSAYRAVGARTLARYRSRSATG